MYFTYSKPINGQDLGAKIYKSERASGEWGEAQEVKLFADSSITVGHPALNASGDTLYFVSDATGGEGGKDIWMAELDGGEWVNAQPLGKGINTRADEMFPYVHEDGTLYFASNGHPGYGGLDLYKASRDTTVRDSVVWELYNLGASFNGIGDDFGITFEGNSQNGFFSSNKGDKKGVDRIYRFWLPEMEFIAEGTVTDEAGNPLSEAVLRIVGSDGTNSKINARRDGTYKIKLQREVKYVMLATARGHLNAKEQWDTKGLKDSKTYTLNFTLNPISRPVKMDNIFYEFGRWEITKASETELEKLVKLLNDNPNITIELSAHTDLKGNEEFNLELSQKRAQSCCDYLLAHGIEKERLTPVGYGKSKPVVCDKALNKQYPFIPVEQALDEAFILSLPADKQEICNQINRRTEFKVLKTTYKLY
jgi:peptidoglycan-associated lipoprotein